MNTKGRKWFARGMAMLLSASMMASMAGCSGSGDTGNSASETVSQSEEEPREQTSSSEESSEAEPITAEPVAPAKIDDNGKPIADFDEFVNGQWRAEQAAREDVKNYSSSFDDLKKEVDSRYKDILKNMDLSTLSEEDGLYKAATLYRQILAGEDIPQRIASIKARLSKADKVKNLKGLYEIYADKENYRVDSMLNCVVAVDGNGYNSVWYDPKSNLIAINENYDGYLTGDLTDQRGQTLLACMNKFGYSEKRAREIITNAMEIDLQLSIFLKKIENVGVRYYFYDEVMQEKEIPIPLVKILTHNEEGWFLAQLECMDFWKEMFQEKNFSKLRDHFLLSMIFKCSWYLDSEDVLALWGDDILKEYDDVIYNLIAEACMDVMNEEYLKRYLDDETMTCISDLLEQVKLYERGIIADSSWLSTHGKELARRKILRLNAGIGENETKYEMADFQLGDNATESMFALKVSYNDFERSQTEVTFPDLKTYSYDLTAINAFYTAPLNDMILLTGYISSPLCGKDAAFEERLAYLGEVIAHEISHAYDPKGSEFDDEGWHEPWMTDDEKNAYQDRVDMIAAFFDGMEVEYGQKISGKLIQNETFADLMAMECCLRILADQENPDYDLFFRTYASRSTFYYTEEGMKDAIKDTHLPSKQRVNYILAQFDKFYEIYDIDESSPYFVPKEKRLPVF